MRKGKERGQEGGISSNRRASSSDKCSLSAAEPPGTKAVLLSLRSSVGARGVRPLVSQCWPS